MQATWLSKLHEAQDKYPETVKWRYREAGGAESGAPATVDGSGGTLDAAVGPTSQQAVAAAHGGSATVAGRGWLDAAGTSSSLIVPSFAVHDYGELVRVVPPSHGTVVMS